MNTLYEHQKRFLQKNPDKSLVVHDTGTGKTRLAIEWANLNKVDGIIICPKALKENWKRNISEFRGAALLEVMSKEEFRKDWEKITFIEGHSPAIIVDEAHHFAGPKSLMTKNLGKFIKKHKIPYILLLTATPYLSTPWNIYTLAKHLSYQWDWFKFKERFFNDRYIGRRIVPEVKKGIENEIAALVVGIGDVVRLDECADIPDQVFETEYFDLHESQEVAIKKVFDVNAIVRFTKEHEIENGFLIGDGYTEDEFYFSNKEDRILELCRENDKVVIVARYNLQLELLHAELNQLEKPLFLINGSVKNRDEIIRKAEAADKAIILINAACSEGYELPSFPLMIFASLSFSYKDYKQICGRILRLNKLKKNVYIHLVSNGVDAGVYDAIMRKQDFNIEIYSDDISGKRFPNGL